MIALVVKVSPANAEYVSDYFVADYVLINHGNLDSYDPEGSNEGG